MFVAIILTVYAFWSIFLGQSQELGAEREPYRTTLQSGPSDTPLACYTGVQNYGSRPFIDNVTVQTCRPGDGCCYMMSKFGSEQFFDSIVILPFFYPIFTGLISGSFGGTHYGCHNDCPERLRTFLCGPDPDSNLQDIYYCYCKDSQDPNCQPTDRQRRRRQIEENVIRLH
jgi:hypothetical protein